MVVVIEQRLPLQLAGFIGRVQSHLANNREIRAVSANEDLILLPYQEQTRKHFRTLLWRCYANSCDNERFKEGVVVLTLLKDTVNRDNLLTPQFTLVLIWIVNHGNRRTRDMFLSLIHVSMIHTCFIRAEAERKLEEFSEKRTKEKKNEK